MAFRAMHTPGNAPMRISGVEIPAELDHDAKSLRWRCQLRMLKWWAICTTVVIVAFSTEVLVQLALNVSSYISKAIAGGLAALSMMLALQRVRKGDAMDTLVFLRSHGYCSCGYKAVPSPDGGVLSCPECGQSWRAPALSPTTANNLP